jgi:perosamine synthetase
VSTELDNLKDVLDSGILSGYKATPEGLKGGKWVQRLEQQFQNYYKVKHALAFSSGTSALFTAVKACGLGKGDTIVTSPITFSATASVGLWAGCKVKFADINRDTYNIIVGNIQGADAIIPVHLMGYPIWEMESSSLIIEDACQAMGAEYGDLKAGTIGNVGCFSFNQGKLISCGEGGMLITNDDKIAHNAQMIRNHGECYNDILGFNFRMTELQAAVVSARFTHLDEIVAHVRKLALRLTDILMTARGITPPIEEVWAKPTYSYYAVRCVGVDRDTLQAKLMDEGIYFGKGGYKPLYTMPAYRSFGKFSEADRMYKEVMFTNILRPPMTLAQVEKIGKTILKLI